MNFWDWICGLWDKGVSRVRKLLHLEEGLLDAESRSEQDSTPYSMLQKGASDKCGVNIEFERYTELEKQLLNGSVQVKSYWKDLDFFSGCKSYGDSNYGKRHGMTIMYSDTNAYMGYVTYDNGKRSGPFMVLGELRPSCTLVVIGKYTNDKISHFTASNEEISLTYEGPSVYSIKFSNGHSYPVAKMDKERWDLQSAASDHY